MKRILQRGLAKKKLNARTLNQHVQDIFERLCIGLLHQLQMRHLSYPTSLEWYMLWNMSQNSLVQESQEVPSYDFGQASIPNLFDLLPDYDDSVTKINEFSDAPDPGLIDFGPSSDESDLDPPDPIPKATDAPSPSDSVASGVDATQNIPRTSTPPPGRIRRKPLETKTLLAQCLLQWLSSSQHNPDAIRWLSKREGLFQITNSAKISSLWGSKKENKKKMNHEKLSRALRHYYKDGTLVKQPHKRRLCYKFSESAMKKFSMYFTEQ